MIKKIMAVAFLLIGTMSKSSQDPFSTCCALVNSELCRNQIARNAATMKTLAHVHQCVCCAGSCFTLAHLIYRWNQQYGDKKNK